MKLYFIGNCINGYEAEIFQEKVANDATEMAQLVEASQPITKEEFLNLVELEPSTKYTLDRSNFGFDSFKAVAWMYDPEEDIHYFYA